MQRTATAPAVQTEEQDPLVDNFFTSVANTKPFLKFAFHGLAGSGKTYTASDLAIGLHKQIKSAKPIVFFDTEKATGFLRPKFEAAGIQLNVRESKSFADLVKAMELCENGAADILIIDSISHVWENFLEDYKKSPMKVGKQAKTRLEFQDWGMIKPLWKSQFSDRFVQAKLHIIMNGRAGYEYDFERNEDTGKRELYKSGVKMKVEGETAYEPDVLVLMERHQEMDGTTVKRVIRQATVIKDRSTLLDGKVFENPSYADFKPVIDVILANPSNVQTAPALDTSSMFRTEEEKYEYRRQINIILEQIEGEMVRAWPSTGAADKSAKLDVLEKAFNTRSWTQISEATGLETLKKGFETIKQIVSDELAVRMQKPVEAIPAPREGESAAARKMREGAARVKEKNT